MNNARSSQSIQTQAQPRIKPEVLLVRFLIYPTLGYQMPTLNQR